jgi:hypothetical protein
MKDVQFQQHHQGALEFAQMPGNPRDAQNNNTDACDLERLHADTLVKFNT